MPYTDPPGALREQKYDIYAGRRAGERGDQMARKKVVHDILAQAQADIEKKRAEGWTQQDFANGLKQMFDEENRENQYFKPATRDYLIWVTRGRTWYGAQKIVLSPYVLVNVPAQTLGGVIHELTRDFQGGCVHVERIA